MLKIGKHELLGSLQLICKNLWYVKNMKKKTILISLAVLGTVLVWIPLVFPVILTIVLFAFRQVFRFDYLMPVELFMFALSGGILLTSVSLFKKTDRKTIIGSLISAIIFLFLTQWVAVVTGLASGNTKPEGLPWILVTGLLAMYTLSIVVLAVGGVLLIKKLFKTHKKDN